MDRLNIFEALNIANGKTPGNDASTQDLVGDAHAVFDSKKD